MASRLEVVEPSVLQSPGPLPSPTSSVYVRATVPETEAVEVTWMLKGVAATPTVVADPGSAVSSTSLYACMHAWQAVGDYNTALD